MNRGLANVHKWKQGPPGTSHPIINGLTSQILVAENIQIGVKHVYEHKRIGG